MRPAAFDSGSGALTAPHKKHLASLRACQMEPKEKIER
jgi:hypothetical protein